ncbi:hypothetical protein C2S51_011412 [Perilla frutescens var. frutescens]|nr:hypothetical protein C2S51_011412 [Perilla frutescens var. frutescens]
MGVPSFYRWLVNKYPKIVSDAAAGGENPPEFDNMYLDMNGIIHPCFHPDDNLFPPTSFDEVFRNMHDYIDRLIDIIRPRKLLFMAIDGVAPRAKMNQQRARRFRAAKDAELTEVTEELLRKQFEKEGKVVLPKEESELSDSNVITPGTEFMHMLSKNLRWYVSQRMNENPAWGDLKVILSDDKAPGEGEHKIMSFIRAQRLLPGYDPNTRHCLYGLDADLIMLALGTHEVHFSILREEVLPPNRDLSNGTSLENGRRATTHSEKSRGWFKEDPWQPSSCELVIDTAKLASSQEAHFRVSKTQAYQILNISILREYLALDMKIPSFNKFECDLERIIDDFIFICFFAGNDFLPHIPSLEIHEGCIDLLMDVYKKEFQNLGGYLVNIQKVNDKKGGYIKLKQVERFILAVGAYEEKIFTKRTLLRDRRMSRILAEYRDAKIDEKNCLDEGTSSEAVDMYDIARIDGLKISAPDPAVDADMVLKNTRELKQKLKERMRNQSDLFKHGCFGTDKVKFGTPGWKERYYKEKFSAECSAEIESMRKSVVEKYIEGLCWVLLYYFSEIPSWIWFYPFYYAPFASDFRGASQMKVKFQKDQPFKPFDQLMAVLPPRSAHALPMPYKGLMVDEKSNLIDFYPKEFKTDLDGKRFMWQGICKLPFIEEDRLLLATRKLESELKDSEKSRNVHTPHQLFMRRSSKFCQKLLSCQARLDSEKINGAIMMESEIDGIKGALYLMMHDDLTETDEYRRCNRFIDDMICMYYDTPQGFQHVPRLLEGVKCPERTVNEDEIGETTLWHEHHGSGSSSRNNYMFQNRNPDLVYRAQNHGFSSGRGKTPAAENLNHFPSNHVGSFNPSYRPAGENSSYRDYGSRGDQPSGTPYIPREGSYRRGDYGGSEGFRKWGSNHHGTSNYRPLEAGINFRQLPVNRSACEDWRANKPSLGDGSQRNYVDRTVAGEGWGRSYAQVSGSGYRQQQSIAPNGSRGQGQGRGRGRGWSAY